MNKKFSYCLIGVLIIGLLFSIVYQKNKLKPNVVFVISSLEKPDAFGSYDGFLVSTKNLDRIANEGVIFPKCYGNSIFRNVTLEGVVSGLNNSTGELSRIDQNADFDQLIRTFWSSGYEIVVIGDWGRVSKQFSHCILKQPSSTYTSKNNHNQAFVNSSKINSFGDLIVDILNKRKKTKPVLILLYQNLDENIVCDENLNPGINHNKENSPEKLNIISNVSYQRSVYANQNRSNYFCLQDSTTKIDVMRNYYATLLTIDANFGRFFKVLEDKGEFDRTVILSAMILKMRQQRGVLKVVNDLNLHIPIIKLSVRYPSKIGSGIKSDALCLGTDIYPTLLDICGLKIPKGMVKNSLLPFVDKSAIFPALWRKYIYFEDRTSYNSNYGLISVKYKLINYYKTNRWELYDLEKDPNELNNVFQFSRYTNVRDSLLVVLSKTRVRACSNFN